MEVEEYYLLFVSVIDEDHPHLYDYMGTYSSLVDALKALNDRDPSYPADIYYFEPLNGVWRLECTRRKGASRRIHD